MPYIPSPLKNFNKNNQFVIIAKTQYYKSVDELHTLTKDNIMYMLRNGAALFGVLLLQIVVTCWKKPYWGFGWAFFSFLLIGHIVLGLTLVRLVRYYSIDHPAIKEFTKMANMEMAEIVSTNMQHEDILLCLHNQYALEGELIRDTKWLKILYWVLLGLIFLEGCWTLTTLFLQ